MVMKKVIMKQGDTHIKWVDENGVKREKEIMSKEGKGLLQQIEEGDFKKTPLTTEYLEGALKDLHEATRDSEKPLVLMFNCKTNGMTVTSESWMPCDNKECSFCSGVNEGLKEYLNR